jgi:hypothetical protein
MRFCRFIGASRTQCQGNQTMKDCNRRDAIKIGALTAIASLGVSAIAKAANDDDSTGRRDAAAAVSPPMLPPIAFDLEASKAGTIYEQKQVFLSSPVTIDRLAIVTTTGCRSRNHQSSLTFGVLPAVNFTLKDCTVFEKPVNISLNVRSFQLQIRSAGFEPGERVHGLLTLEYH